MIKMLNNFGIKAFHPSLQDFEDSKVANHEKEDH